MSNAKRPLATTFRLGEVIALDALINAARSGKDVSVIVRNQDVASAHGKIVRMREKAKGAA